MDIQRLISLRRAGDYNKNCYNMKLSGFIIWIVYIQRDSMKNWHILHSMSYFSFDCHIYYELYLVLYIVRYNFFVHIFMSLYLLINFVI